MSKRTEHEQNIEQVALLIAEHIRAGGDIDAMRDVNDSDGFVFDVRYDSHKYADETSWSRVEGCKLSESDFAIAVHVANDWLSYVPSP